MLIVCADSPKRAAGDCPNLLGGRSKTRSNAAAFGRCIGSRFATLISSGRLIELHAPAKLNPMQRPSAAALDLVLHPPWGPPWYAVAVVHRLRPGALFLVAAPLERVHYFFLVLSIFF